MESTIKALAAYQISNFFSANGPTTKQECDEWAKSITGEPATPTQVQGGSSYLYCPCRQLRCSVSRPRAALHLEFLRHVQKAYADFMPCFFASAWHKTPTTLPLPDREALYSKYSHQLSQLEAGLPERFRPVLQQLSPGLKSIMDDDWRLVPNHIDLLENNIHVDPRTGELKGICDWAGTETSPFGMSVGEVAYILGIPKTDEKSGRYDHVYHANHQELRGLFYDELYRAIGEVSAKDKRRIKDARLVGLFLTHGWRCDDACNQFPAGEEDVGLQHLDAVLRATCDGYQ